MESAAPGGRALSICRDDQRKAGDPWLEEDYKEDKGALSVPSQPFFWFKSVATCPCRWKAGIPGPGEKMTSAVILCEADVQPLLGSAEMQPVWEVFATAEALAGSRSPQLRVFCV